MFNKEKESSGKRPDYYSRDGIAIWKNLDKNGKEFLTVRIGLLGISVNCFQSEREEQFTPIEEIQVS
jgi:hypothetical protein